MNLTLETIDGVSVITLPGRFLNASNHEDFMESIAPILKNSTAAILDLSQLESIDSSGLGVFAFCMRIMRDADGKLYLCSPTAGVKTAFDLVHIRRIIDVFETREEEFDLRSRFAVFRVLTEQEEQMEKGKIILLNGASSSGKSGIAKELQNLLDEPYMHLGLDTVFTMIPRKCKCNDPQRLKAFVWEPDNNGSREVRISVGDLGHKVMTGFHRACATLCFSGINLILDHVLFEPSWTKECFELFRPFAVCFVGVLCPIEVLEIRERERGDRQIGLARFCALRVHEGKNYDIEVDTSIYSQRECAKQIVHYFAVNRSCRFLKPIRFGAPPIQSIGVIYQTGA